MKTRIAYFGSFSEPWSTESYIAAALEAHGHEVHRIEEHSSASQLFVLEQLLRHGPFEFFLFAKGRFGGEWDQSGRMACEFIREARRQGAARKFVCWVFDLLNPAYSAERYQWAAAVSEECDLFLTTDGSAIRFLSPKSKVLRQGVGHDFGAGVFRPELACDVLFLGTLYGQRKAFAETLQGHFGRRLWVIEEGVRGPALNDLMASARLVIAPPWPTFPEYWSNRLYVVTGYGGVYCGPKVDGMEREGWISGTNYFAIDRDWPGVLDFLLKRPFSCEEVRDAGRKLTRSVFTYHERVRILLELVL